MGSVKFRFSSPMSSSASPPRIAVLGAGITGLAAAWNLQRDGFSSIVFEKSDRVGGAIGSIRREGWLHELGPNSLVESLEVAAFVDAIGLGSRRLYAASVAKHRYVMRDGRLVALPVSPFGFVTTRLFSWRAKLALLGEPWRKPAPAGLDESVAAFTRRRLGNEFLDYAVNPFVAGVYAGDPERLSVQHAFPKLHALEQQHGSLIRGALKRRRAKGDPGGRIFSFPDGLGELPAAIARTLRTAVRLRTTVKSIRRTRDAWEIVSECGGLLTSETYAAVVCALSADALAALGIEGVSLGGGLNLLREIEHPPVVSILTGFKRTDVRHPLDGFGVLVPEVERRRILGTLFSSTLFAGRAPDDHVALTTFVGGTRHPPLANLDDRDLLRVVQEELAHLVGTSAAPVFTAIQRWPRAIPQYAMGYQRFKAAMANLEIAAPGLLIGGNARDGISLANCIASGQRMAEAVKRFIDR
jgi:protoporphyrinogen/coproporphyrinogen III oxidase